jgi:hypothetical protein
LFHDYSMSKIYTDPYILHRFGGDQLWSVPKLEYDLLRRNASTNVRKTDLIERYILHRKPKHLTYAWIWIPSGFIKAVNFKIFFSIIMDSINMTNSPGLVSESCHESTFKLINIIVFAECPSCPDWKENIIKIMMTDQFECAFVTGFRDKTRRICHIYAIHYNWKKDFEVNCLCRSYSSFGTDHSWSPSAILESNNW